jgi:hypothetical protein
MHQTCLKYHQKSMHQKHLDSQTIQNFSPALSERGHPASRCGFASTYRCLGVSRRVLLSGEHRGEPLAVCRDAHARVPLWCVKCLDEGRPNAAAIRHTSLAVKLGGYLFELGNSQDWHVWKVMVLHVKVCVEAHKVVPFANVCAPSRLALSSRSKATRAGGRLFGRGVRAVVCDKHC